jgi:hypothetical protein
MDSTTDENPPDETIDVIARAVAPAFGSSSPMPVVASAVASPAASPPREPELPPLRPAEPSARARTPELMGADELAAPPRPFPPPPVDAMPLVTPPTPAHLTLEAAPPPATPLQVTPLAVTPLTTQQPTAMQSTADPFARLLTTSTGGGGVSSAPNEPLRLGSMSGVADRDVARTTVGEWIVLLLAIIAPPIGVIAAIVGAIGSLRRRGWVVGVLKVALPVGIVLSVVLAVTGYFGYKQFQAQQLLDQTASASAAFCSTIKADPTMIALPDFGWPAPAASIPDSITAMQAYADSWKKLAAVSPPGIAADVTTVASTAQQLTDAVDVSRTVNDASNVSTMTSVASASSVPAWFTKYCG